METPASWKEFDASGDVKFLQLQDTAAASLAGRGSVLDSSIGERIIEIQAEPTINATVVEWSLENKGPNDVWVVSAGIKGAGFNMKIAAGASSTCKIDLDGSRYTYIVVDCQAGKKTQLSVKAKMAETDAKTARGVFAVGDGKAYAEFALDPRQQVRNGPAPGPADNVSYEQETQHPATWHTRPLSFPL